MRSVAVAWRSPIPTVQSGALLDWRAQLSATHYGMRQRVNPTRVQGRSTTHRGNVAFQLLGAWTTRGASGPFLLRAVICPVQDRMYLLDGWLHAPDPLRVGSAVGLPQPVGQVMGNELHQQLFSLRLDPGQLHLQRNRHRVMAEVDRSQKREPAMRSKRRTEPLPVRLRSAEEIGESAALAEGGERLHHTVPPPLEAVERGSVRHRIRRRAGPGTPNSSVGHGRQS